MIEKTIPKPKTTKDSNNAITLKGDFFGAKVLPPIVSNVLVDDENNDLQDDSNNDLTD